MHRLTKALRDAAQGRYPAQDGVVEVTGPPPGRAHAVVSFPSHSIVATSLPANAVEPLLVQGDPGSALHARTLVEIGRRLGAPPGSLDLLLVAMGPGPDKGLLLRADAEMKGRDRVRRARNYRDNITVWTDDNDRIALAVGQGLAKRWEISIELEDDHRSQALAAMALQGARTLLAPDVPLWAQVAPSNAASLRAFLAAGFTPVGAEVLFLPGSAP